MNTSSELDTFKSTEYAHKFFYFSKIVCTESLPDSKTVKELQLTYVRWRLILFRQF